MKIRILALMLMAFGVLSAHRAAAQTTANKFYHEPYRLQVHFSPKQHWMNDPNGMVYFNGTYHLFFQYYPGGNNWGPMHWGHAITKDLVHWKELPIALYPDSLGYIFSGSVVVDTHNTAGFGKKGITPLVAIFTHHDPKGEKDGSNTFQNQSLAYSLNEGRTWIKYKGNPVLKNPGITDFRDPKVMWYAARQKWVMTLATKNKITFYTSPNLKNWTKESEFGAGIGEHNGVWECPDLFPLKLEGKTYWVLIVNINPSGPNGGSGTQYFIGQFDGHNFTPLETTIKWLDYGPDEYAGVTWSNTGDRRIFLGWMSNWAYAGQLPTSTWRNAMTVPKTLALANVNGNIYVTSTPVTELKKLAVIQAQPLVKTIGDAAIITSLPEQYALTYTPGNDESFTLKLRNKADEQLTIGYDKTAGRYYIDRQKSGNISFNADFGKTVYAPRLSKGRNTRLTLVMDNSSVELFADGGLTVMTALFFPSQPYDQLQIESGGAINREMVTLSALKSIW